jgi:hypothetical protein
VAARREKEKKEEEENWKSKTMNANPPVPGTQAILAMLNLEGNSQPGTTLPAARDVLFSSPNRSQGKQTQIKTGRKRKGR